MHRKFKEKMAYDLLLDEIEQLTIELEGMVRTATLLHSYCSEHQNIQEIYNMVHIAETLRNQFIYISQEMRYFVNRNKYNEPDISESFNINSDNVIIEDD